MKRIENLLNGKETSHILPFLWMKGEDNETIKRQIDQIEKCGIREICLESRPHPDFCGPGWWNNLDFICEEARKRNMRLWILDDDKFPTGHANGGFSRQPDKKKIYLVERHMDIHGPCQSSAVLVENFLQPDGRLLGILAVPKPDGETLAVSGDGIINLTENYHNGFVYFDLPKGPYRLFILFTTQTGGGRDNYINLIDSESVQVLINEVYEKHYEHYQQYFGNTIAGFFSDEPELGNVRGYPFDNTLGQKDQRLPWSKELMEILSEKWGEDFLISLPALWYDSGARTKAIRSEYMDVLTKLVNKCFSGQLGKWCEDHGVEYIGHIIEDDNAHTRMGCSIGHYFREMEGQHMAGIDVVHHQIVPGFTEPVHQWIAGDRDGEFFHFGLAKLGSSAAHIQPNKKGRALCEIFGNYGWAEGNSLMKWLTNHMLVRGINEFTPHAFSMKYPDPDCPPHFYADGKNPGFECFCSLMKYMNRGAYLLSGGQHLVDAAVLYHAESEWCGGNTMYFHKPGRKLMERQLDYDVIPADVFGEDAGINKARVENGQLKIWNETYPCLILPYAQYLDERVIRFVSEGAKQGLRTFVIDELPQGDVCGNELPTDWNQAVQVVELESIAQEVARLRDTQGDREVVITDVPGTNLSENIPDLRSMLIRQQDGLLAMFFNESLSDKVCTQVFVNNSLYDKAIIYDCWHNSTESFSIVSDEQVRIVPLCLEPGEVAFVCLEKSVENENLRAFPVLVGSTVLDVDYQVTGFPQNRERPLAGPLLLKKGCEMPNLNGPEYWPSFTGVYQYECTFELEKLEGKKYQLVIPEASDCVRVLLNGNDLGHLAGFPAKLDITGFFKDGKNVLCLEVATTLVWERKDGASTHLQVYASGITKPPVIEWYQ